MAEKKSTNACLYMALGCFGIIVLIGIGIAVFAWWAAQKAKEIEQQIKDPIAREAKVKELLGAEELPEGYYAGFAMRVPFTMDMVILSDQEPQLDESGNADNADPDFDEQGFMYFRMLEMVNLFSDDADLQKMRDFFQGKSTDPRALRERGINIDMDLGEQIGTGEAEVGNQRILFNAFRGKLDDSSSDQTRGLVTLMMIECSGEPSTRMAFWATRDPHADLPVSEADYSGTAASAGGVQDFMSHFQLCH